MRAIPDELSGCGSVFLRPWSAKSILGVLIPLVMSGGLGCSSGKLPTYPVTGFVVFPDGDPVRLGTIEFRSREHAINARGKIQPDGHFVLGTFHDGDGAVAGQHGAVVVQVLVAPGMTAAQHHVDHGDSVDPKFSHYETSGLEFTVMPRKDNEVRVVVERARNDQAAHHN